MKHVWKRGGALLMAFAMLLSLLPAPVFAAELEEELPLTEEELSDPPVSEESSVETIVDADMESSDMDLPDQPDEEEVCVLSEDAEEETDEVPGAGEETVLAQNISGTVREAVPASQGYATAQYINPIYADVLGDELPEVVHSGTALAELETYYDSVYELSVALREGMKDRTETISLGYTCSAFDEEILNEVFYDSVYTAVDHTGIPTEGDYLFFQFGGARVEASWSASEGVYYVEMVYYVTYYTTAAQENEMNTAVDQLLSQLDLDGSTEYEKIKGVYDYICSNVTYDYDNLEDDDYLLKYSAYAGLVNGTAVCQGYAVLFYRLMLELGVDARVIASIESENHAWNIVGLDGLYYNLDATWDAGISSERYAYFLLCPTTFGKDHTRSEEYDSAEFHDAYPMAEADYGSSEGGGEGGGGDEGGDDEEEDLFPGASGTCDNGFAWVIDTKGTLTISGTGPMEDYSTTDLPPWREEAYKPYVRSAIVGEGITSVGEYAFCYLTELSQITLPSTIETIGTYAFGYTSLEGLTIPEGVTELPVSMCADTQPLTTVVLPSTLVTIGNHAFSSCDGLTNINFPAGLTTIGEGAFFTCSKLNNIVLPTSLVSIGESAFASCKSLTSIAIPDGITTLPDGLLSNCTALTEVKLPESLKTIGNDVFTYCTARPTLELPDGLTGIGISCFINCTSLERIEIPGGVAALGNSTFLHCTALESITLNEGLQTLGNQTFGACERLKEITLPSTVTKLDTMLFYGCDALAKVTFLGSAPSIGDATFNGVTCQAWYPYGDSSWTSDVCKNYGGTISWNETAAIIASGSCGQSVNWTLDSNGLLNITGSGDMDDFEAGAPWQSYISQIKTVQISSGVTSVGEYAFSDSIALTEVILPEGLTCVSYSAFMGCPMLESVELPSTVTVLEDNAFRNCTRLTSAKLDCAVTAILSGTFAGCSALTEVILPDGLVSLERESFADCAELTGITLPEGLETLGVSCFKNCVGLTEIRLPESVTYIGGSAFSGCTALTSINIPEGVTAINSDLFYGCTGLTSLQLPESVNVILNRAFSGCTGLSEITMPKTLSTLGERAFYECEKLTSIVVPEGITQINGATFSDCSALADVRLPEGLTAIGTSAFSGCTALTTVALPESLETIGNSAFSGCFGLTAITFHKNLTSIETKAFYLNTDLTQITFLGAAPAISSDAFYRVEATVNYPGHTSWTADVRQNYGGTLTWNLVCTEHTPAEAVEENWVESTCTVPGSYDSVICCAICSTEISREKKALPLADHEPGQAVEENRNEPTCTVPGSYDSVICCAVCDQELSRQTVTIAVVPHTAGETVKEKEVAPACGKTGSYDSVVYCSVCGSEISRVTETVPALEHIPGDPVTEGYEPPTFSKKGSYDSVTYCTRCGAELSREAVWIDELEYVSQTMENGFAWSLNAAGALILSGPGMADEMPWLDYADHIVSLTVGDQVVGISSNSFAGCVNLKKIQFLGDAPLLEEDCFAGLNADACFYAVKNGWTDDVLQDYGGNIVWTRILPDLVMLDTPELVSVETTQETLSSGITTVFVSLQWQPVEGAAAYEIYRRSGETDWELVGYSDSASYRDNFPDVGVEYTYTVACEDVYGRTCSDYDPDGISHFYPSGSCGEEVSWKITSAGELQISGVGAMNADGYDMELTPWYHLRGEIRSARVEEGVTHLSAYAFQGCTEMTSVTLANSITSIGQCAFFHCPGLTSVNLPDGITEIGYRTFYLCTGLSELSIPAGVTAIGEGAFDGCSALSEIQLPEGLTQLGKSAFGGCKRLTEIVIPAGITQIAPNTFYSCTGLKSIALPEELTEIGSYAFANCYQLAELELPEGTERLDEGALLNCRSLTELTIPAAVVSLGEEVFLGCENLSKVIFLGSVPEGSAWFGDQRCQIIFPEQLRDEWMALDLSTIGSQAYRGQLEAPELTKASGASTGITLQWTQVADARGYYIYRGTSTDAMRQIGSVSGSDTLTYRDASASSGVAYFYQVAACAEGGEVGEKSEAVKSAILANPVLSSAANAYGGVKVSWKSVSGAERYQLWRKTADTGWKKVGSQVADTVTVDATAESGVKYTYTVRAHTGLAQSGYDKTGKSVLYLEAPEVSKLENKTNGMKVTWNTVAGAKSYQLWRKTETTGWKKVGSPVTAANTVDTTAVSGTTYFYTVRAINGSVQSSYNNTGFSGYFLASPTLKSASNVASGVNVTWNAVDGAESYQLWRKVSGGKWGKLGTPVSGISAVDTTTESGVTYVYTVRAVKGDVQSGYFTSGVTSCYLAAPELTVSGATGKVTVKWTASEGCTGYHIYRKTTGSYTKIASLAAGKSSYTDSSVTNGTLYTYKIQAYKGSYLSAAVTAVGKPLATPTLSKVSNAADGVKVTWKAVTGAASYQLWRKTADTSWKKVGTQVTGTSAVDTTAESNVKYTYTVRAHYGSSQSGYNKTGLTIHYLATPTLLSAENTGNGIRIVWEEVVGAESYQLWRKTTDTGWKKVGSPVTGSSTVDASAQSGVNYYYTVRAISGSVQSSYHTPGISCEAD